MVSKNFTRQYHFNVQSIPWTPIEEWLNENKIPFTLCYSSLTIKRKKYAMLFTLRWGIEAVCFKSYPYEMNMILKYKQSEN